MKLYFSVTCPLPLIFLTCVYTLSAAPELANTTSSGTGALESPYLHLPVFQHSRNPLLDKEQFSPLRGSGREQLPEAARRVLKPRAPARARSRQRARSHGVNVLCQTKKMIVKVSKHILPLDGLQSTLKLGTCDISKTTKHHHVFNYDMDQCASKRKLINNRVTYSNVLHYSPAMDPSPIRRAMPFSVPIECHFNRYHYSYKIGYIPEIRLQSHFKPLRTMDSVVLTPRDEQWRRLSPTEEYTIGHPMYFQVDGPSLADDERLVLDACFVTSSSSHLSVPRFTVIENHGCMIDSKSSRWSRFIHSGQSNVMRFSLDAFLFQVILGEHLYMHCEISIGSLNPKANAKSCTYNQTTNRWEELYGSDSVCLCCDSTCVSPDLSVTSKIITSDPWIMESDLNFVEEETGSFMPEGVGTGFVQVVAPPSATAGPRRFTPDTTVVGKDVYVERRRTFEEVFGLD